MNKRALGVLFLGFMLTPCIFSVSFLQAAPDTMRTRVKNFFRERKFFQAATLLGALVEEQGKDASSFTADDWQDRLNLAKTYRELNDLQMAKKLLGEALVQVPEDLRNEVRLEILKTLYLEGQRGKIAAYEEAYKLYQDLPGPFSKKIGFTTRETESQAQYYGALAAFRSRHLSQAKSILQNLAASPYYSLSARYLLGKISLQEGRPEEALKWWDAVDSTTLAKNIFTESVQIDADTLSLTRLSLGKLYLSRNFPNRSTVVFGKIDKDSRYAQEGLLGRGLSLLQIGNTNRTLEAMVFLNRSIDLDPESTSGLQARLLLASAYMKLQVPQKASAVLTETLRLLGEQLKVSEDLRSVDVALPWIHKASDSYYHKKKIDHKKHSSLKSILQTKSSLQFLPLLEQSMTLEELTQENIHQLSAGVRFFNHPGFNPYVLLHEQVGDFPEVVNVRVLANPLIPSTLRKTHQEVERRLRLFMLTKLYSRLLLEERQWQNVSNLLLEKSLSEKIQRAERARKAAKDIRNYYLDKKTFSETQIVTQFKEQMDRSDQNLFLEDRVINQANLFKESLSHEEKRLKQLANLTGAENARSEKLQKEIFLRQKRLADLEKSLHFYRSTKRWKTIVALTYEILEAPALDEINQEINRVKQFLARIQKEDEAAQQGLVLTLNGIQENIRHSHQEIDREILKIAFAELLEKERQGLISLKKSQEALQRRFANSLVAEIARKKRLWLQYQSMVRFELAKVMDKQTFQKSP